MDFYYIFMYICKLSILIPLLAFFFIKSKRDRVIQAILLLVGFSVITEIINEVFIRTGHKGTLIWNLFFIIQFGLITYLYAVRLFRGAYRNYIIAFSLVFLAVLIATLIHPSQSIHSPQNAVWTAGSIIVIIYGGLHISYLTRTLDIDPFLYRYGPIWISFAFIMYFSFDAGLFYISGVVLSDSIEQTTAVMLWNIHNLFYLVKNIIFTYAMIVISGELECNNADFAVYQNQKRLIEM